jgi:hypothetical protein
MYATSCALVASIQGKALMQETFDLLPWPLLLAVMGLGILLVLIACLPTAWVERLLRYLHQRFGDRAS